MNDTGDILHIPVFIINATENESLLMEAYNLGAVDVITKPFMMTFLKCRIENIIELYDHRNDLEDLVNDHVKKMSQYNQNMVEALATLVEFRDCESGEHIKRICGLTDILMNKVSSMYAEYRLPKSEIDKIVSASVLHDVGKIAISDSILNKPGRLTPEEFEVMKEHTTRGCEILKKIPYMLNDNVYNYSYDIARHHHERWDGMGYPDNLEGDKITIWAQVVSVVDVYDALVSPRVYKKAFDHDTAVKIISGFLGKPFNPSTVVRKVHTVFSLPEETQLSPETSENELSEDDINKTMVYIGQLTSIYGDYLANTGRSDVDYKRVSDLMAILLEEYARKSGTLDLDKTHINLISKAAYFFDIGRMSIPDELILKHKFVDSNKKLYETHTQEGAHIIQLNKEFACRYFVKVCSDICIHHHERFDGLGYPHGIKGNDIAYHTQLCSLVTEFDRLFSKREEINEWQFDFIIKELKVDKGRFDPKFIEILEDCRMSAVLYYKQKLCK